MGKKPSKRRPKRKTASEKLFSHIKGRVFVFIDAANLEKSVKDIGMYPPRMRKIPPGFLSGSFEITKRDSKKEALKAKIPPQSGIRLFMTVFRLQQYNTLK